MRYFVLLVLVLAGCSETKTETTADTTKHDQITVQGTFAYPAETGPVMVPVNLTISRDGSTSTSQTSVAKTQLDVAALGQQIGGVVAASVGASLNKLTGGLVSPSSPWVPKPETAAAIGALGLWGVREMLNARAHKKDADAGWDEALKATKQPKATEPTHG